MKLDKKDLKILEILKENSKLTTSQIYKKTNIPITTIHNRIKKLENLGIIKGYTLKLDYNKLGKPIAGFILITINYLLPNGTKIKQEYVAQQIRNLEGVEEVSIMTGVTDILIKIRVSNIEELNDFIIKKLRNVNGIDKTQTMITLSSY